ncbi:MAG: archease [Desulfarculaceae bacterium]|nr:archease [Desulfarculaceae bacterium]MCF8074345.1 archease [Desulfarculaceae bacterium]MCF8103555.1 archease [Desulfarculaceae bacterium]MCF8117322.1 archease [Desulfarculaceae bacterium]
MGGGRQSLVELFEAAPAALAELMVEGPRGGEPAWLPFGASGADQAELLVALLSEVVFLWDAEARLVVAARVEELSPTSLTARLGVIPADPVHHRPGEPVKAVTYHQARVEPRAGSWRGHVILDV